MTTPNDFATDPKSIRRRLGLNQQQFWSRIGVTQSGGSRYESGRRMPKPVLELFRVVHVERIDLARVTRADCDLIELLRTTQPQLYASLLEKVGGARPRAEIPAAPSVAARRPDTGNQTGIRASDLEELDYEFSEDDVGGADAWSDDRAAGESLSVFASGRRR